MCEKKFRKNWGKKKKSDHFPPHFSFAAEFFNERVNNNFHAKTTRPKVNDLASLDFFETTFHSSIIKVH